MIVVTAPGKYRRLAGAVKDLNGEIVSDVLVEVYDKPEYLLLKYPESEEKKKAQRRLEGCIVGADGKFCFRDLPPGDMSSDSVKPADGIILTRMS